MECEKCSGTGECPKWPNPYMPLPVAIIQRIRENAPKCDRCNGTGKIGED